MLTPPRLNFSLLILLILATDSPVYQKHVILLPTSSGKQLGLVFPRCSTEQQTALPICLPLQIPFRQSSFLAASMIKNSLSIRMPVTQSKIAGARTEQGFFLFCFVWGQPYILRCFYWNRNPHCWSKTKAAEHQKDLAERTPQWELEEFIAYAVNKSRGFHGSGRHPKPLGALRGGSSSQHQPQPRRALPGREARQVSSPVLLYRARIQMNQSLSKGTILEFKLETPHVPHSLNFKCFSLPNHSQIIY